MKRFVLPALILTAFCFSMHAKADLNDEVNAILREKALEKVDIGIEIVQLGASAATSRVVYRHNNDQALIPASNLKVLTTSAALDRLGPDFKFRTQLVYHNGELILIGDGDPSFGDAEMLSKVGWDVTTVFQNWSKQVKQLNLGPIKSVVVDDSIFDEDYFPATWPADQRASRYEAEVSGMNLNMNCVDVLLRPTRAGQPVNCVLNPPTRFAEVENHCVTGEGSPTMSRPETAGNKILLHGKIATATESPASITIHDGSMFAATVLNETLATAGVACQQPPRKDRTMRLALARAIAAGDRSWQVLAIHETPLPQVLARANKDSMNLYGECLCKRLGADSTSQPGSWANGTAAVGDFLKKLGVPGDKFRLDDGCGLSKLNAVPASVMTRVLVYDYFGPNAKTFVDSLSIAGTDGTLSDRFAGAMRGRVFAKTGHVSGVSCLSGYLNAQDGRRYAFAILMNKDYAKIGNPTQEKIVAAIDSAAVAAAR